MNHIYCNCQECRDGLDMKWALEWSTRQDELLKGVMLKAKKSDSCGFCSIPCGNEHCPYTENSTK